MGRVVTRPATVPKHGKPPSYTRTGAGAAAAGLSGSSASNRTILSFFKKVPPLEESMFVASSGSILSNVLPSPNEHNVGNKQNVPSAADPANGPADFDGGNPTEGRFNECSVPMKRRRLSPDQPPKTVQRGPFVDDSDSEEDDASENDGMPKPAHGEVVPESFNQPPLLDSHTSFAETFQTDDAEEVNTDDADDFAYFADADLFNDMDLDGEELRERKYVEEQARIEATTGDGAMTSCCPICGASLAGSTPDQATVHVNACLDGGILAEEEEGKAKDLKPSDAPKRNANGTSTRSTGPVKTSPVSDLTKRAVRTAQPRPGQANPIGVVEDGTGGSANSAFARLMSGHAENAAWATAAAAESASRGRPAYERTCPFYKIMPGFFICVDAFRYGAVEGCRAYFLSHFHSDHYVGLTAKWCHGPIYCSAVTASLVRSQLGTAAKWIVPLDFEATVDVPGTEGVRVTMIPANHCPGSSMFLFEKNLSTTGGKRTQRILHCGDFRACRAHVDHPLLAPETVASALAADGKATTQQQKIDVCYLDTTYLNPRYSFPPQDDVVAACAKLCVSLDCCLKAGEDAAWNGILRHRESGGCDGSGSVKDFLTKEARKQGGGEDSSKKGAVSAMPQQTETSLPPPRPPLPSARRNRLLVICGTYSIGKERICKAIAKALNTKIFASPAKIKIVAQLGDPELSALMTSDPTEAQVHMQMLMDIRAETLSEYLASYCAHFSRIIGFRPSGWNYRPTAAPARGITTATVGSAAAASLAPSTLPTTSLLHGSGWRTRFGVGDLLPQRGSTREAVCFGVPYSEHSSFRELALFLMALRIERVVPTVNVGSEVSRKRMKGWIDRWQSERRRGGILRVLAESSDGPGDGTKLWEGKDGLGGGVYW